MTVSPFVPKGEVAEWRLVYDEMKSLNVGDVLTYERLSELLERDFQDGSRGPYFQALQVLERDDHRSFDVVRGKGYRMVEALEHARLAQAHHRKARRSLVRSMSKAKSADRSGMSAEDRARFDSLELNLGRQQDMIRRLEDRQVATERALRAASSHSAQRDAGLEERLARLESLLGKSEQ